MTSTVAHLAALQFIKDIAEGSTTANSLPHIAKIAAAALGGKPLDSIYRGTDAADAIGHRLERSAAL